MGKRVKLVSEFKVVYVPLPLRMVEARRASLLLLLRWIREARNEIVDIAHSGHIDRGASALHPLALVDVEEVLPEIVLRIEQAIRRSGLTSLLGPALQGCTRIASSVRDAKSQVNTATIRLLEK
jgi:hypothetical protein